MNCDSYYVKQAAKLAGDMGRIDEAKLLFCRRYKGKLVRLKLIDNDERRGSEIN